MDPPAYTVSDVPPPPVRRSVQDMRSLILGSAAVLKPRFRSEGVELVVAKSARHVAAAPAALTTRTPAGVTLTFNSPPHRAGGAGGVNSAAASGSENGSGLVQDAHCAFLVTRQAGQLNVNVMIRGQPMASIEEALEWMVEETEVLVQVLLERHGKPAFTKCCPGCSAAMRNIAR